MYHQAYYRNPDSDVPPPPPAPPPKRTRKPKSFIGPVRQQPEIPGFEVASPAEVVPSFGSQEALSFAPADSEPAFSPADVYAEAVPAPGGGGEDLGAVPTVPAKGSLPAHVILVTGEGYGGYFDRYACTDSQECERLVEKLLHEVEMSGGGHVSVLVVMRTRCKTLLRLQVGPRGWANVTPDYGVWERYWTFRGQR